mgnify:CR=1 FL=1
MNTLINKYCSKESQEFIYFHSTFFDFKKNELLFDVNEEVKGVFILESGKVKIVKPISKDKNRVIRLASNNDIVGHRGIGGEFKYTISAVALDDTKALFMPLDIFNQTVKTNPEFAFFMMMFFANELCNSETMSNQYPVKNLVAQALIKNINAFGFANDSKTLAYTLTRKEISEMVGTTYESVIRSLAQLQKEGMIQLSNKDIIVPSEKKLNELAFTDS